MSCCLKGSIVVPLAREGRSTGSKSYRYPVRHRSTARRRRPIGGRMQRPTVVPRIAAPLDLTAASRRIRRRCSPCAAAGDLVLAEIAERTQQALGEVDAARGTVRDCALIGQEGIDLGARRRPRAVRAVARGYRCGRRPPTARSPAQRKPHATGRSRDRRRPAVDGPSADAAALASRSCVHPSGSGSQAPSGTRSPIGARAQERMPSIAGPTTIGHSAFRSRQCGRAGGGPGRPLQAPQFSISSISSPAAPTAMAARRP